MTKTWLSSMTQCILCDSSCPVADPGGGDRGIYPPTILSGSMSVDLFILISLLGIIIPNSKYNFDLSHFDN